MRILWILLLFLFVSCAKRSADYDTQLRLVGQYMEVSGDLSGLTMADGRAWAFAEASHSVLTFDLDDAAVPYPVARLAFPDWQADEQFVSAVTAESQVLFVATTKNVKLLRYTDQMLPEYIGWDFSGQINHVFPVSYEDDLVLLASDRSPEDGVQSHRYDLADSSTFWQIGEAVDQDVFIDFDNDANDLLLDGDYLYVADGMFGLKVFHMDSGPCPIELSEIATLPLAGDARRVVKSGSVLIIAAGSAGTWFVDVSNPYIPVISGRDDASYTSYDVVVDGSMAFVANGGSGIRVLAFSADGHPELAYRYELPSAQRIAVYDDLIGVIDGEEGLLFFENPAE